MSESDPSLVARTLADALAAEGVPYALGGALAHAYWGVPRATKDADFNVFVGVERVADVARALAAAGVTCELAELERCAANGDNARARAGSVVVDLFFNSIPLHVSAAARVVERPLHGRPIRLLSAEDLIVLKLLFFRGKDLVDVQQVIGLQRDSLDRDYVRRWLVELVGQDNERVAKWDELAAAFPCSV